MNYAYDLHIRPVLEAKTAFDGNLAADRANITNAAMAFACKVMNEANPSRQRLAEAQSALNSVLDYRYRDAVGTLIEANRYVAS